MNMQSFYKTACPKGLDVEVRLSFSLFSGSYSTILMNLLQESQLVVKQSDVS